MVTPPSCGSCRDGAQGLYRAKPMKTYDEINAKIEKKQAVVMTAKEITGYVEKLVA